MFMILNSFLISLTIVTMNESTYTRIYAYCVLRICEWFHLRRHINLRRVGDVGVGSGLVSNTCIDSISLWGQCIRFGIQSCE